jgi:hypothetical protein
LSIGERHRDYALAVNGWHLDTSQPFHKRKRCEVENSSVKHNFSVDRIYYGVVIHQTIIEVDYSCELAFIIGKYFVEKRLN